MLIIIETIKKRSSTSIHSIQFKEIYRKKQKRNIKSSQNA